MKHIAILGANSQIARDLIVSFSNTLETSLHLFSRRPDEVTKWLADEGFSVRYPSDEYAVFPDQEFDAVINFVGVGNPAQAVEMGNAIFDLTLRFDEMVLTYLRTHSACRYLFLSSGAAYGSVFDAPVKRGTPAVVAINDLAPHEWYGVAKLHAECRHRANPDFSIFDIRVFNYFSRTQDISARFLIADILRAICHQTTLMTSPDHIVRDYLSPLDFFKMINALLAAPATNVAVDCYSRAPIAKSDLLKAMQKAFGLRYEIVGTAKGINATGNKPHYYSQNDIASQFGYQPDLTSMESILQESKLILAGCK